MRNHRLSRLTLLTQGIALIGFGMSELACAKDQPNVNGPNPEPVHINAPPQPTSSGTESAVAPAIDPPQMNAIMPPASASAAPSTSTSAKPPPPPQPKHVNGPPRPHINAPMKP